MTSLPSSRASSTIALPTPPAAALATSVAAPSLAQEIKISHQFKANADGRDLATRVFVEEATKRDPSLKFRIYPGSSLGIKPVAQLDEQPLGRLRPDPGDRLECTEIAVGDDVDERVHSRLGAVAPPDLAQLEERRRSLALHLGHRLP